MGHDSVTMGVMPKLGMEPIRKEALIKATIDEIGRAGSLDVTVGQIARRAGMSSALAHHYFGSKDAIFRAAMRAILTFLGDDVRAGLAQAQSPVERLDAILEASFSPTSFRREVIAAWLNFYVLALSDPQARRLLAVYQSRMRSNLRYCLRPLVGGQAWMMAENLAALIDGVYLREALKPDAPDVPAILSLLRASLPAALWEDAHDCATKSEPFYKR